MLLTPASLPDSPASIVQLRAFRDVANITYLFARDSSGTLWSTNALIGWDSWSGWTQIATQSVLGETSHADFVPVVRGDGGIDILAKTMDGGLVALSNPGAVAAWSPPVEIMPVGTVSDIDVVHADGTYDGTEAFCIASGAL